MGTMEDSIFTKIIKREIPADIVYEDNIVIAFLDIKPINHGHTLIVPKKPFTNIFDGDDEDLAHMMKVAHKLANALKQVTNCNGINILMNNGEAAGQEIFHSHMHIIPRITGDRAYHPAKHLVFDAEIGKSIVRGIHEILC
jgi:histidine triad (HIT) family protein